MGIPVCIPAVPKSAKKYVNAAIDKNWVSSLCLDEEVNFIKKLEDGFSAFVGAKYGIAVTNGTTALDLAVAALKIGPGDEVIVPTFTMIASASSVIHNGARPVFVDSDPDTWCIDTELIEQAITEKTKAIMPVHIYGYPVNMDKVIDIASKHKLYVIEDAAEAIGTEYKNRKVGSIGDIGTFSFYANKTITSGEGGIVVTSNEELSKRVSMLKDQAFGQPRFIHEDIGFNFRMNNLTAAYAYASFEEAQEYIEKKIKN
ncbi:MAG: DegT/DnrJ/EryC1/StrS family aminotransferase, partial [Candidatus Omnitrophica bacterium]|nr:DegT/DnrJ/EryC1/StrS family aminotransferase [Candidatus Omnitrophota bacterium]